MGNLCSKSSSHEGGHTILSAESSGIGAGKPRNADDRRAAAAAAAEQRQQAESSRGTNAANPKKGQLAAKLEASKAAPRVPEGREEERVVWD